MNKNKRIIRWIVLVIVALVIWFLYNLGGNLLKPVAVSQIRQMTGARVDINDIKFHLSGKISIKNIRIGPIVQLKPDNAILTAKSLDAYFSPLSFLKLSPKLDRLRISDFVLNIQFNADKKEWNIATLKLPTKTKGQLLPELRFKYGEIKFSQINKGEEVKTVSCNINGGYAYAKGENGRMVFTVTENLPRENAGNRIAITLLNQEVKEISVEGYLPRLNLSLFGSRCNINSFSSKIIADKDKVVFGDTRFSIGPATVIDVNGIVRDLKTDPAFMFAVKMKDLNIQKEPVDNCFAYGSRIFDSFIPLLQVFFDNFSPQGRLGLDVILTGRVREIAKTHCDGYLDCKDISISYFLFPYLVEHLNGRIDVTETSMTMKKVKAAHGKVDIEMNGYCNGFGETMDSNIVLTSSNMLLDDDLYAALMPSHKKLWYIFSPAGMVSGDFIYAAEPPNTRIFRLYADLLDVSIMCHYFPYEVGGITGKISVDCGVIELKDVLSRQSGGTIKMDGKITDTDTPNPQYNFWIKAENMPIDNKLISAFPEDQKKFFTNFDIKAGGDADIRIHSVDNNEMPVDYLAKLSIRGDVIRNPKLSQPLTNVILDANLTPETIEIKKFAADFNTSPIFASGTIWTGTDEEPMGYCMQMRAQNLTLDSNTVKPVLGENSARLLKDFEFDGAVNIEALVGKNSRIKCPDFQIGIECLDNTAFLEKFDLPLKGIKGKIIINPDNIEFVSLAAVPVTDDSNDANNTGKFTLDGNIKVADGDVDWASLKLKAVDLSFDPRLTAFLGKAENYYDKLAPEGKIDLSLDKVAIDKNDNGQKTLTLNGIALFKGCSIGNTKPLSNIYAILNIDTQYDIGAGMKECKLLLDVKSLSFKGRPIENLRLKIPYDTNNPDIVIKDFVGDCLGGKIIGDAVFKTDNQGTFSEYSIDLAAAGVSSEKFVSPDSAKKSGGALNGELSIHGNFQKPEVNLGRIVGQAEGLQLWEKGLVSSIRNAILEAISKDLAFDNIKIQAVVKGNTVHITKMDLYGVTAALRGTGTYEPASDTIEMDFVGYGAAGKDNPGIFDNLTSGLGAAFLKVYVTGTLAKPNIKVEPLPILKQSLGIIGTK